MSDKMNGYAKHEVDEATQMVTMPLATFHQLMKDSYELNCLHNGGVSDWEWYEEALEDGGFYMEYNN